MIPGVMASRSRLPGGAGASDPYWANVVLLAHFDGTEGSTAFVDSGPLAVPLSLDVAGSRRIDTLRSVAGGASLRSSDTVSGSVIGHHAQIAPGTSDFTVECFCRWESITNRGLFQLFTQVAGPNASIVVSVHASGSDQWTFTLGGSQYPTSVVILPNAWYHVAITRQVGVYRCFIDGVLRITYTNSTNITGGGFAIGTYYSVAQNYKGNIDEFRITKGVARYTAPFTVPSVPFPSA